MSVRQRGAVLISQLVSGAPRPSTSCLHSHYESWLSCDLACDLPCEILGPLAQALVRIRPNYIIQSYLCVALLSSRHFLNSMLLSASCLLSRTIVYPVTHTCLMYD